VGIYLKFIFFKNLRILRLVILNISKKRVTLMVQIGTHQDIAGLRDVYRGQLEKCKNGFWLEDRCHQSLKLLRKTSFASIQTN
jgi:hypothetical protein